MRGLDLAPVLARGLPDFRGKGRMAFWAWRYGSRRGDLEFPMRLGHRLVAPKTSHMTWLAAFTGHYDDALLTRAIRHFEAGSTVLDVGGCFGFWTIPLGRVAQVNGGKVIVFEPVPANRQVLWENVCRNGLVSVVDLRPYGLGSQNKKVVIEVEGGVGNATITDADLAHDRSLVVDVRRLDDEGIPGHCSFIKLDVEGYEMEVLEGAHQFITQHRPIIFGEFNEESLSRRRDRDSLDYKAWAEAEGYLLEGLTTRRPLLGSERIRTITELPGPADMIEMIPSEQLRSF